MEQYIAKKFVTFMERRADQFSILRRVPVEGYDISFLITFAHVQQLGKQRIIDFVCNFIGTIDRELNYIKISITERASGIMQEWIDEIK